MVVGLRDLVDCLLVSLLCDGHVLILGVPGLAKTLTVSTMAQTLSVDLLEKRDDCYHAELLDENRC